VYTPPVKIAHIDTERGWRGGQQQVLSLIEGLRARHHEGIAIVRAGGELERRLQSVVPTFGVSPWTAWSPCVAASVRRRLLAEKVDIVHAHTGNAVAIAALAAPAKMPSVATRRVDFPVGRNPLSRWKYNRMSRLVAISKGVKNVLLSDGFAEDRIDLVPSGVDFRRYEGIQIIDREEMGVPGRCLVVGQVAALAPHKDQPNFLRAVALLRNAHPNLRAVIVGDGKLRPSLEALAGQLGISDIVRFLGHRTDALRFIRGFDVFCLSSWGEGLGTSIIDAMALEVPVAATRVGGIPELVEDGVTGFLAEPRQPESLAAAIERALNAANRREVLTNARRKAELYSIVRTVDEMEKVYARIIEAGR
jgi:glycosyltransferase involved in cell wall biosynthesis